MTAAVIVGLLGIGGVVGAVFYLRDANRHAPESTESEPVKQQLPAQDIPKTAPLPPQEIPKTAPPKPVTPMLLPEPSAPAELSGDEVFRRLLRSTAFVVTPKGVGSGVLIDPNLRLVLTNAHVVEDNKKVAVLFPAYDRENQVISGTKYYLDRAKEIGHPGEVVSRSLHRDLALIQLAKLPTDVRPVGFAKQPASTGSTAYSIGGSGVSRASGGLDDGHLWRLSTGTVRGRSKGIVTLQPSELALSGSGGNVPVVA